MPFLKGKLTWSRAVKKTLNITAMVIKAKGKAPGYSTSSVAVSVESVSFVMVSVSVVSVTFSTSGLSRLCLGDCVAVMVFRFNAGFVNKLRDVRWVLSLFWAHVYSALIACFENSSKESSFILLFNGQLGFDRIHR